MLVEIIRDDDSGSLRFRGELTAADMRRVRLDGFDMLQLRTPATKGSDMLLDLELIFRRLEQQDELDRCV